MVEPPIAPNIVVLQIDRAELRVAPRETVPFPISLEQAELGDPVELRAERSGIGLEPVQDRLPSLDDLPVLRCVVLTVHVLAGKLQVFPLQLQRGHLAPVGEGYVGGQRHVARHVVDRGHRVDEGEVRKERVFDHLEHDRRGP